MQMHRMTMQPTFERARGEKDLPGSLDSTSGLWRSSSGSTRLGLRSEPHSLGSGESVNWVPVNTSGVVGGRNARCPIILRALSVFR